MTLPEDDRIYAEQVRLVLDGVAQSVIVGFLVSSLAFAVLWPVAPHGVLGAWYAAFLVERTSAAVFAWRARRLMRHPDTIRWIERVLLLSKVVEGSILGLLPLIALPLEVPAISAMTLSLMGAAGSNGVSLLAPRRLLYLALVIPIVLLTAATLWSLNGRSYHALAICSLLFVVGQYGQVVLASRQVRDSIALRFENAGLVERLRSETAAADIARRDAEQANATKSQLLATISHDLRQPVQALTLFHQALRQTRLADAQLQIVNNAEMANSTSADMLDRLLDFSRLEAGAVTPRPTGFALQPLLREIENDLAPLADAKRLVYRSSLTDVTVVSDPALLAMILRNLVLNAIRYTDRGGLVVGCRRRGESVSIEVYDTGIGIHSDEQEDIFQPYYRVDDSGPDGQKGVGLGLAIVQRLAASLQHPVTLSSKEGRGSVFRILVPTTSDADRH